MTNNAETESVFPMNRIVARNTCLAIYDFVLIVDIRKVLPKKA
jgi:hypothetical protein